MGLGNLDPGGPHSPQGGDWNIQPSTSRQTPAAQQRGELDAQVPQGPCELPVFGLTGPFGVLGTHSETGSQTCMVLPLRAMVYFARMTVNQGKQFSTGTCVIPRGATFLKLKFNF